VPWRWPENDCKKRFSEKVHESAKQTSDAADRLTIGEIDG
jgi:hypothetical protein